MAAIPQSSRKVLETRIRARIRQLGDGEISIGGSLTVSTRRCGRKNCQCAHDESKRHPAASLTYKVDGKTKSVYVPVDMIEEVRSWIRQRQKIKRLLKQIDELAEQIIRSHVPATRAATRNRAAAKKSL